MQDTNEEKKLVWVAWAIIIGIIGPVGAFIGPNLFHEITKKTGNTLYIDTPILTNFLFLGGVIFLVVFCTLMYWGRRFIIFTSVSFLVALGLLYLSCNHYLMITKGNLVEKPLFSFSKISYDWDDIKAGKMIITDTKEGIGNLVITFNDGYEMAFERNKYMLDNFGMINRLLKENGVVYVIDIQEELKD